MTPTSNVTQTKVWIVVYKTDDYGIDAQAYVSREAAERDFPDADIQDFPTIVESTVQR